MPLPAGELVRLQESELAFPFGDAYDYGDAAQVEAVIVQDGDDVGVLLAGCQPGLLRELSNGSTLGGFVFLDSATVRNSSPVSEPLLSQWIRLRDLQGLRR